MSKRTVIESRFGMHVIRMDAASQDGSTLYEVNGVTREVPKKDIRAFEAGDFSLGRELSRTQTKKRAKHCCWKG